ncbi:MAG: FAD:protein FMN transferase [Opitutales bacterium]|jgi:thiamine biosynthesis lipoprotein ApbE|nr:FAD:protein FMN transferase [Opitutales bacterium]
MSDSGVIHNFSHQALGTRFWIRIADEDYAFAERAAESVFFTLDRLHYDLNGRDAGGILALINQLPEGEMISVSEDFCTLWKFAEAFKKETAGIFDVSAGTLFRYWTERGSDEFNPDDDVWEKTFQDYKTGKFELEGNELRRQENGRTIDFSGIIHGYACDRMAEMLESNWGIHRAILGAGSNVILALDPPGEARGWRVGLGHTLELKLCRTALASKPNNSMKSCLVNPLTGLSVPLSLEAIRAVANTALEAEALTTVGVLLSQSESENLLTRVSTRGLWLPGGECLGMFKNLDLTSRN